MGLKNERYGVTVARHERLTVTIKARINLILDQSKILILAGIRIRDQYPNNTNFSGEGGLCRSILYKSKATSKSLGPAGPIADALTSLIFHMLLLQIVTVGSCKSTDIIF